MPTYYTALIAAGQGLEADRRLQRDCLASTVRGDAFPTRSTSYSASSQMRHDVDARLACLTRKLLQPYADSRTFSSYAIGDDPYLPDKTRALLVEGRVPRHTPAL